MDRSPVHILLAEDDPTVVRLFQEALEDHAKVTVTGNGREAFESFSAARPDVVFSDIRMPERDGMWLLEQARKVDPDVPLILTTAHTETPLLIRAVQLGAFDFIEKPFDIDDLMLTFERAVAQRLILQERQRRDVWAGRIVQVSRQLNAAESLEALLEWLQEGLAPALGVRLFSMFLRDPDGGALTLAATNHVPIPEGTRIETDALPAVMRDVWTSGRPLLITNFDESDYGPNADDQWRARYEGKASAAIPLHVRGQPIGILNVNDKEDGTEQFDALDESFLTIAGEHVASALSVRQEARRLSDALTDLKRTQRQLILHEKLASVAKLVAGVAHELKNPLTSLHFASVNLRTELDRLGAPEESLGRARRSIEAIERDTTRITDRVNQFLRFAAPRQNTPTDVTPADAVQAAIERLKSRGDFGDIRFELALPDGGRPVFVDGSNFVDAIHNVILNGAEAMEGRGIIRIRVEESEESAEVTIRDQGPGIPDDVADHVFDVFLTTKPTGTGIGLSQVFVFCDTHGGSVRFDTGPTGTTFVMRIPWVPPTGDDAR